MYRALIILSLTNSYRCFACLCSRAAIIVLSPHVLMRGISGGPPINYCVSLGPSCHAAEFLKCHPSSLRGFALPFDWIHSDPALVCSCLDDNLQLLLQRHLMGSDVWTAQKRRGCHKVLRTDMHESIFEHHDPAAVDDDFKYLHRSADRLRRVLSDTDSRTLFMHLALNAAPGGRDAFIQDVHRLYSSLRRVTTNFDLLTLRVVHRQGGAAARRAALSADGEVELVTRIEPSSSFSSTTTTSSSSYHGDVLHCLELSSLTRTVVPFATWREQGTPDEVRDVEALTRALARRFIFEPRVDPPAHTPATLAARAASAPLWVWATEPTHFVRESATPSELRSAAARLPGGTHPAVLLLNADPVPPVERIGPEAREAGLAGGEVDVAAWAQEWIAQATDGGVEMCLAEWTAATERLAAPASLSVGGAPRLRDLVTNALRYQLAELMAERQLTSSQLTRDSSNPARFA